MDKPIEIPDIRNITISGRIGTGKTTLANNLAKTLHWKVLDGGKLFRRFAKDQGFHISEKHKIPDEMDLAKYRKLYVKNDPNWVYWNPKYYDLIINTFDHNTEESLRIVLKAIGIPR